MLPVQCGRQATHPIQGGRDFVKLSKLEDSISSTSRF